MRKHILFFSLLLLSGTTVFAQCSSWIEASKGSGGAGAHSLTTDAANNVYSTGSFEDSISFGNNKLINPKGGNSYYINKFNSNSAIQWAIQLQVSSQLATAPVIYQKKSALYIAGTYYDTLTGDFKNGNELVLASAETGAMNFFLLKLDLNGNLIWGENFVGSRTDYDAIYGITVSDIGQVYLTGTLNDSIQFGSRLVYAEGSVLFLEAFLTKTDSNGNVIWADLPYTSTAYPDLSGRGVTTDNNNNVLLTGYFNENITFGSQTLNSNNSSQYGENPFVAKFDSAGNCQWITGGQGNLTNSPLYAVTTDALGYTYIAGAMDGAIDYNGTTLNPSNGRFYYARYTPAGNLTWIKQTGNSNTASQTPTSLVIDASNNLWMSGWVNGPVNFGNYYLNDTAVFIVEFDTTGTILNVIGSKGTSDGYSCALDGDGSLYVGCFALSQISFDGASLTPDSYGTDVILKYCTTGGKYVWPGDANNDLLVNNYDLLPIGVYYGQNFRIRPKFQQVQFLFQLL
jgi:hypothetical protein